MNGSPRSQYTLPSASNITHPTLKFTFALIKSPANKKICTQFGTLPLDTLYTIDTWNSCLIHNDNFKRVLKWLTHLNPLLYSTMSYKLNYVPSDDSMNYKVIFYAFADRWIHYWHILLWLSMGNIHNQLWSYLNIIWHIIKFLCQTFQPHTATVFWQMTYLHTFLYPHIVSYICPTFLELQITHFALPYSLPSPWNMWTPAYI